MGSCGECLQHSWVVKKSSVWTKFQIHETFCHERKEKRLDLGQGGTGPVRETGSKNPWREQRSLKFRSTCIHHIFL